MPSVQFKINGVNFGSPISSPPYTIQWTPATGGNYNITYEVTADNGTKKLSKTRNVSVRSNIVRGNEPTLLGMNLPAMADYFAPYFRDAAKQCRPYEAIGGGNVAKNANGYPTASDFQVYIWAGAARRHGTYTVTITHPNSYSGGGTLTSLGGTLSNIAFNNTTKKTTATWVHTDVGESVGLLRFQGFTGGITNLKVMRPVVAGSTTPYDESKLFMDTMIDVCGRFDGIRLLDTTGVNSSSIRTWSERTLTTDYSQARDQGEPGSGFGFAGRGLAWEYVCDLANEVKAEYPTFKAIWCNIPVLADDNYLTQFFTLMRDNLHPDILLQCEFGNENWNFAPAFIHAAYNRDEAVLEAQQPGSLLDYDGDTGDYTLAWRRQAKRSVDMLDIATTVYGASVDSRVEIQLMWQPKNDQNTAGIMSRFIDKGLNRLDAISKFGLGGNWYYGTEAYALDLTADNMWNRDTMDVTKWANEWLQVQDVHFVAAFTKPDGKIPWNLYEGGTNFDKVEANQVGNSQAIADKNNTILKAANYDPRVKQNLIDHIDIHSQYGANWRYCYKLGGAQDNQYPWAFIFNHDDLNTPKMEAVQVVRGRNKPVVTFGRLAPYLLNAGLISLTDRGFGDPDPNEWGLQVDETVSYTFRLAAAGNYSFSVRPVADCTLRLYLGTTVLINSVSATADTFTTPISFNCPNPGLYSFRVRNLGASNVNLKQIQIV